MFHTPQTSHHWRVRTGLSKLFVLCSSLLCVGLIYVIAFLPSAIAAPAFGYSQNRPALDLSTLQQRIENPVRQGGATVIDLKGFTIDIGGSSLSNNQTPPEFAEQFYEQLQRALSAKTAKSARYLGIDFSGSLITGDLQLNQLAQRIPAYGDALIPELESFKQSFQSSAIQQSILPYPRAYTNRLSRFLLPTVTAAQSDTLIFQGPLLLNNTCFNGLFNASNLYFLNQVEAEGALFTQKAQWQSAKFAQKALFSQSQFQQDSSFRNALFAGRTQFSQSRFNGPSSWQGAVFYNTSRFAQADFQTLDFSLAHWHTDADFERVRFRSTANFQKSRFDGSLFLTDATLEAAVNLRQVQFQKSISLRAAHVMTQIDFGDARFAKQISRGDARFAKQISRGDARFAKQISRGDARFAKQISKGDARFAKQISKGDARFAKQISKGDAHLTRNVSKAVTINVADLDFSAGEARILGSPGQIGKMFSVPTLTRNETVLRNLVRNFRLLEQIGDANQLEYTLEQLRLSQIKRHLLGTSLNQASHQKLVSIGFSPAQATAITARVAEQPFVSRTDLLSLDEIDLATYLQVRDRITTQSTNVIHRGQNLLQWLMLTGLLQLSSYGTNVGLIFSVGITIVTLFALMFWAVDRYRRLTPTPIVPTREESLAMMISSAGILAVTLSFLLQSASQPLAALGMVSLLTLPVPGVLIAKLYQQGRYHDLMDRSYFVENGALRRLQVLIARLPVPPKFPFFRERYTPLLSDRKWNWLNYYDFSLNNWFKFGFNDIRLRDRCVPGLISALVWYQWSLGVVYITLLLWTLSRTIPGLNLLLYF